MMQIAIELSEILHGLLSINKSRVKFIVEFVIALIKVRTVNWVEISQAISGKTKLKSKYRRIQRFFQDYSICKALTAQIIAAFFPKQEGGWLLSLDRTNWNFGVFKINILMLSITHQGLAIPLLWIMLPKKGNSNTNERIELLSLFLKIFDHNHIASIVADREFIGDDWIQWLNENNIRFTIRIKNNQNLVNMKGKLVRSKKFFYKSSSKGRVIKTPCYMGEVKVFLAGMKLHTNEWLVVITNHEQDNALARYKKRWGIETLFAALKTRGFNLEDTHVTNIDKIDTLVALLSIAYVWAFKIGEITAEEQPIKVKSHNRKEQSVFRLGLDLLRSAFFNLNEFAEEIKYYIRLFSKNLRNFIVNPIELN